jgi:hypothetical protein
MCWSHLQWLSQERLDELGWEWPALSGGGALTARGGAEERSPAVVDVRADAPRVDLADAGHRLVAERR